MTLDEAARLIDIGHEVTDLTFKFVSRCTTHGIDIKDLAEFCRTIQYKQTEIMEVER